MFIHQKLSSNINEVIRSVLNLFFFMIRFYMHKKHKKNTRHQKAQKALKAQNHNQTKAQKRK